MEKREGVSRTRMESSFPLTHWTLIGEAAGGENSSKDALESFCKTYWYPLYSFARRSGSSASDAEDLTQGFLLRLLEGDWLSDVDRGKGKLRTFLLTAFRRYQANEWRKDTAARRGGGRVIPMSGLEGIEERYADAHPGLSAEELFDRQWALALLARVLDELQNEFRDGGKEREFEILKSVLMADRGELDYAELSRALDTTEGAARVAAHRLRKKFRTRFREVISETLEEDADLSEEMAFMAKVLAK